ncbi:Metallophosphoesterase OS=uncultured planctomycete GN=HGMM_F11F07C07 PE=4 SV=1: Metallophos_2 [Gemmataceae bacterium]|nr:Metallophosphoesterase OS=uncultured planctomycete GN=HGMM_F11F07C07 PE=4 SV=1: Metallophos_2 [Gemmataceae bacterium]VTT97818.1 Metallophosphoesterase OS=uncultured planctomycete GN=HGMM_F11F07C07 PE=4 SV=1: Metallophos_2 [Gemmataceae bacterium]
MKPPFLPHHAHTVPKRPTVQARVAGFIGRNWARVGYAYHVEPTWLEVNRVGLRVRGLPAAFHGVKVAHLTDFHFGRHIPHGYIENALARAAAERPDLIALTGDFIDKGPRHVRTAAKMFRGLTAPLGVYGVLGNHDFSVHTARGVRRHAGLGAAVADALESEGVSVLRNRAVRLDRGGAGLVVAGVDDLWSGEADPVAALGRECPNTPRVVLAHNPQSVEGFAGCRADLVLSGHTHGGQIDWPGLGRILLNRRAKRWAAGLYRYGDGHLYVNKGVGFGWRFRFGVRPEVAVFTLNPE